MDIDWLVGLTLEQCKFSKSSYTFEFSGKKDDTFYRFSVSTSQNLSSSIGDKDVYEKFSIFIWPFLETRLTKVVLDSANTQIFFEFEEGNTFKVWAEEPIIGELLVVHESETGNWFTV